MGVVKVRGAQPTVLSRCGFDGFFWVFCLFVFDYRDLGIAPTASLCRIRPTGISGGSGYLTRPQCFDLLRLRLKRFGRGYKPRPAKDNNGNSGLIASIPL